MRVLVVGVIIFIAGLTLGGCNSLDEKADAARQAEPTVVTETVEVPGPTVYAVSDECRAYIDLLTQTTDAVYAYEAATADAQTVFRDANRGIVLSDVSIVNQSITDLNNIESDSTGPLQTIVANVGDQLPDSLAACQATLED